MPLPPMLLTPLLLALTPSATKHGVTRRGVTATSGMLLGAPLAVPFAAPAAAEPASSAASALTEYAQAYAVVPDSSPSLSPSAESLGMEALLSDLAAPSVRAVFLGEHHNSKADHELQEGLLRELHRRRSARGAKPELAVGLEAVQRRFQPALDAYLAGELDENALQEAVEWRKRWCVFLGLDWAPRNVEWEREIGGRSAFFCCCTWGILGLLTDGVAECAGSGPSRIMRQCSERAKSCRKCLEKSSEEESATAGTCMASLQL